MTPDNKIINGLWGCYEGETLSNLERLCIYSFCANGHDFRLWSYYDIPNLPRDTAPGKVELCDAESILSKDKMFVSKGGLAHFSDWFRWEFMYKIGGLYADTDVVCLRPFNFSEELFFGRESESMCHAHVMRVSRGHKIAETMAHSCANPCKVMPWDDSKTRRGKFRRRILPWQNAHKQQGMGELGGPKGLTGAVNHLGLQSAVKPMWYFDPIPNWEYHSFIDDSLHERDMLAPIFARSFAIHFSRTLLRRAAGDFNKEFHPNSPFEILKRRYLPELRK